MESLDASRALWNRSRLALESDEVLAQILDRGGIAEWREMYRLCRTDRALRSRIARIVQRISVALPRLWPAALGALGEPIDVSGRRLTVTKGRLFSYRHRNSRSASPNDTTSHALSTPSCGKSCARPAPCSMCARSASISAVSGRALMNG